MYKMYHAIVRLSNVLFIIAYFFVLFRNMINSYMIYIFFFFFQAEDGIRDLTVTGVQTCALPICRPQRRTALYWEDGTWAPTIPTSTWLCPREHSGRRWTASVLCTISSRSSRGALARMETTGIGVRAWRSNSKYSSWMTTNPFAAG